MAVVFDGPRSWEARTRRIDAAAALGESAIAAGKRAADEQASLRAGGRLISSPSVLR